MHTRAPVKKKLIIKISTYKMRYHSFAPQVMCRKKKVNNKELNLQNALPFVCSSGYVFMFITLTLIPILLIMGLLRGKTKLLCWRGCRCTYLCARLPAWMSVRSSVNMLSTLGCTISCMSMSFCYNSTSQMIWLSVVELADIILE